jgi:hypothetical protein
MLNVKKKEYFNLGVVWGSWNKEVDFDINLEFNNSKGDLEMHR